MKITETAKNLLADKTCQACYWGRIKGCFAKKRKYKYNTCENWEHDWRESWYESK